MVHQVEMGKTKRRSFSRINEILKMPDLIEVQKDSYRQFVERGFGEVLEDISPIKDFTEKLVLEFTDYKIDKEHPKYDIAECKERDVNYISVGLRWKTGLNASTVLTCFQVFFYELLYETQALFLLACRDVICFHIIL